MPVLRSTALLLICLLLGGCTQWRHYELGQALAESEMPRPEDGWTLTQVMQKLGPPLRMSAEADGYVMAWEYWEIDEYKVGFGLGFTGADSLNADWGKARVSGDFLLLTFSRDHRLLTSSFEEWDRDAGGGQGVQPLVSAVDVVDVDDLREHLSQHRWGAQSLRRLPVTLNQQNRLDSGQAGLEQRGTTGAVGQHALELR
ncbi:MAG: hypothetical protein ABJ308_03355 [Halieaceae bacterium]